MTTSTEPLIEIRHVERAYYSGQEAVFALKDVSMHVDTGEYISLMGPSGSGKTTLFNCIGGLDFPTSGEVFLGGRSLGELEQSQLAFIRCRNIGYIFQNYNLIEVVTALENVTLPMRLLGMNDDEAKEKAARILTEVGLGHRLNHLPNELSGGQQQRIAIARALANDPALILADEPTANLDSVTGLQIVELLNLLSKDRGVTVVSATHDHRMLDVSDRVVHLRGGEVDKIVARKDLKISIGKIDN